MIQQDANPTTNIIVLHQGALGDFVLTLSVVQAIQASFNTQNIHVTAIASASSATLAAGRSVIDTCVSPEIVGFHQLFSEARPLQGRLATMLAKSDLVLSFLGDESSPVHRRLREGVDGLVISIDPRPKRETLVNRRHITSQWIHAIQSTGMRIDSATPPVIRLPVPDEPTSPANARTGPRRLCVHPGSGSRDKCWPLERFTEWVDSLDDVEVIWVLGAVELERDSHLVSVVQQRVDTHHDTLVVENDLMKAGLAIRDADVYVGNDSGMTHLAAALGVRTVAVFGPTDPQVWRPLGEHVTPLEPQPPTEFVPVNDVRSVVIQLLY